VTLFRIEKVMWINSIGADLSSPLVKVLRRRRATAPLHLFRDSQLLGFISNRSSIGRMGALLAPQN